MKTNHARTTTVADIIVK